MKETRSTLYRNDKLVSMRNGSTEYLSMSNIVTVTQRWCRGSLTGFYFPAYLHFVGDSASPLALLGRKKEKISMLIASASGKKER